MDLSSYTTYLLQPALGGIKQVLELMHNSLYAFEMQSSYSTQMALIDETSQLPSLSDLRQPLQKASVHRTTAIGCFTRIQNGDLDRYLIGIAIKSMVQAKKADQKAMKAMSQLKEEAKTTTAQQWVASAAYWLQGQAYYLEEAIRLMKTMGMFPEEVWLYSQGLDY